MSLLGLIIKATRQCNLRCEYCHDWRSRYKPMSFQVLANLMKKSIQNEYYNRIQFIWHGGEPLLLGTKFFEKALFLQNRLKRENQVITNTLQTNGTLLTDEWCEFFKKYNFHIGVSLDGPEIIHNRNRYYASGKGSFNDVKRGISLLQKHNIRFGTLMVLNSRALSLSPKELFDFFLELGVNVFSFLPVRPDNVKGENTGEKSTPDYVNSVQYTNFMKNVFDEWYKLDRPDIQIRELNSLTKVLLGGRASVCTLAGYCIGKYFHIEANGDVYHCDKYMGDNDYHLGNINDSSFEEICRSDKILNLVKEEKENIEKLKDCEYFDYCNGGCPHDRYIAKKYLENFDDRCCGQKELIKYIADNIHNDVMEKINNL